MSLSKYLFLKNQAVRKFHFIWISLETPCVSQTILSDCNGEEKDDENDGHGEDEGRENGDNDDKIKKAGKMIERVDKEWGS